MIGKAARVKLSPKQRDFVALDVETANYDRASICQIGMVKVLEGEIVDEFSTLINQPYVDEFFADIHGIKVETLRNAPSLRQAFEAAAAFVGDMDAIVTHTSFDRSCLSAAGVRFEGVRWLDTAKVARRCWQGHRRYGLQAVTERLGFFDEDGYHNALGDARMAARVLLAAFEHSGEGLEHWLIRAQLPVGRRGKSGGIETKGANPEGEHFGETVCFTGTMEMRRQDAVTLAERCGFTFTPSVGLKTDYLVVGIQTAKGLKDGKSTKQRKAESLLKQHGLLVRILTEGEFLALCEDDG